MEVLYIFVKYTKMKSSEFFNSWDIEIKEEYKELYHDFFSSDYIKYFNDNENIKLQNL